MTQSESSRIAVSAVIVTHNSQAILARCLTALFDQEYPLDSVVLVDSGSSDTEFLKEFEHYDRLQIVCDENIGFARANNLGFCKLPSHTDYVLFVNPDLFVLSDTIEKAVSICEENPDVGVLSGRLLGYDMEKNKPSGRIDSTGIVRQWYGRWIDRGQGEPDSGLYMRAEDMPALCGAFLFCRSEALKSFEVTVFDPEFFLYKEDIELSIRLREKGWKLRYHPDLEVYHCRGWQSERAEMSPALRLFAAKSEMLLYKKHPSPYMAWAVVKYILVRFFRL
jgi:GT2 family glycosyltransferase